MIVPGLKHFRRSLPLLLVSGILSACGQTGALYLPEQAKKPLPADAISAETSVENRAETDTETASETTGHQH